MRGLVGICAASIVAFGASGAIASTVLFTDNFDSEVAPTPPGWVANYTSFANFFVGGGTVDLLGPSNPFGLTGSGNFVDLDGSTNQGGFLETIPQFSFAAGETLTLDVLVSGNQRTGTDGLFAGFRFFTPRDIAGVSTTGFTSTQTPDVPTLELLGIAAVPTNSPYQNYTISFRALSAGKASALVGTTSNDNIGPLLDQVTLSAVVPEPAGWALMLLGFGGIGAVLRRRREAAALPA